MPHQSAVTVRATLAAGYVEDTVSLLRDIRRHGHDDPRLPFARMPSVHFARLFVLDEVTDLSGRLIPASLVYMCDVDAPESQHLYEFATLAAAGIDLLFGACDGYPSNPSAEARAGWLASHSLRPAAEYVHTRGRGVRQIQDEGRLREAIETSADGLDVAGASADSIRQQLAKLVTAGPEFSWATEPADTTGAQSRLATIAITAILVVIGLVLLPILLPILLIFLLLIRYRESRDVAEAGPVDLRHAADVEQYEDWATQNPFTAVGFVKAGFVRHTTMRVALAGLNFANRHFFGTHTLAGVRTLHFARWVPLDDGRRLVFASSYDGSQESYMNDFIDRLWWGLNLVFSNGVGYPSTRWLIFGGARDELAFKRYLRRHQVPTVVWYSAYPTLHAPKIDANATMRRGLGSSIASIPAEEWVASL